MYKSYKFYKQESCRGVRFYVSTSIYMDLDSDLLKKSAIALTRFLMIGYDKINQILK